jgi:hypothetical protein
MPTLYLYFGIRVYFYANEHAPIHVHGEYQSTESKAEIFVKDGNVEEIRYSNVADKRPLSSTKMQDFKALIEHEVLNIINAWEGMFLKGMTPKVKKITRRLK